MPGTPGRIRYSWIERTAVLFAVVVAFGFFLHQWRYPSELHDAWQYGQMGRAIVDDGFFSRFMGGSAVRTYGYPLFLSLIHRMADATAIPVPLVLFGAQLGLYLGTCALLRQALRDAIPPLATPVFCGLMANYYALVYAPEPLTESLSLSAAVGLAAAWLRSVQREHARWWLAGGSLLAGFAMMIRPANAPIAAAWIVGLIVLGVRQRRGLTKSLVGGCVMACLLVLPFLPQLQYNVRWFDRWTPLLAFDLSQRQQVWGIRYIKYATAMPPSPEAAVYYVNPWLDGTNLDETQPLRWYTHHPVQAALTSAVDVFNLTDQDLLFPYSRNLDPWYRLPLGLINHAVVIAGLIGLIVGGPRLRRDGSFERRTSFALLGLLALGTVGVHSWVAVEMRFGMLLLGILFPAAAYALIRCWEGRPVARLLMVGVVAAYVPCALGLSAWVRSHAPLIQAEIAGDDDPSDDRDGVPASLDACPHLTAETDDGCPRPMPRRGAFFADDNTYLIFLDPIDGDAFARGRSGMERLDVPSQLRYDLGWTLVAAADLTLDGRSDLLWQQQNTGIVSLAAMNGFASASEQTVGAALGDPNWRLAATGDFNGDGRPDLVWQQVHSRHVAIWFMQMVEEVAQPQGAAYVTVADDAAVVPDSGWEIVGVFDTNGDGTNDLLLQNGATAALRIWELGPRRRRGLPIQRERAVQATGRDERVRAIVDISGDDVDEVFTQDVGSGAVRGYRWERRLETFVPVDAGSFVDVPPGWQLRGPR